MSNFNEKRRRLMMYVGSPGAGPTEHFEMLAEEFYGDTGYMAPGKSVAPEIWAGDEWEAARRPAWNAWVGELQCEARETLEVMLKRLKDLERERRVLASVDTSPF